MSHSRIRIFITTLMPILLLACLLPGMTPPSSAPVPTFVPLETIIAATFSAAQTQTAVPLAEAPAVGVTEAPAMTGTTIEKLPGGTTKYTDYEFGVEIVMPNGWLAVRPNSEEFNQVWVSEGPNNPLLNDQMTYDQKNYEAGFHRLYTYIIRPDIQNNVMFGFSKLIWDANANFPLDNTILGDLVHELETSVGIPGFRTSVAQLTMNANGVQMIEIGGPFALDDAQGEKVEYFATWFFFKPSPDTVGRISFSYLRDYRDNLTPDIKSVVDSIKLLQQ